MTDTGVSKKACFWPSFVVPLPMIRHESLIEVATVRTLKFVCERSQSVLRSDIWPLA